MDRSKWDKARSLFFVAVQAINIIVLSLSFLALWREVRVGLDEFSLLEGKLGGRKKSFASSAGMDRSRQVEIWHREWLVFIKKNACLVLAMSSLKSG